MGGQVLMEQNTWFNQLHESIKQTSSDRPPPHHQGLKRASVLVLLDCDGNLLLNERSQDLKSHPGEICFPGGKQDPADENDDIVTALRECKEEVGLEFMVSKPQDIDVNAASSLPKLEILGCLPTIESLHHLCVTPVVAITPGLRHDDLRLTLNSSEVDSAFWIPLSFFVQNTPIELVPLSWSNETFWYRNYTYTTTSTNTPIRPDEEVSVTQGNKRRRYQRKNRQYNITGLTAHVAHQAARMAFPQNSGHILFRSIKRQRSSYWIPKHFEVSFSSTSIMLHQYDHEWQRQRKQNTATKKNRLLLGGPNDFQMVDYNDDPDQPHAFQLISLEGKVIWTLAAMDEEGKEAFRQELVSGLSCS